MQKGSIKYGELILPIFVQGASFVYLAVILDSYSRKVIGYSLSHRLDTELASNALRMAIETRKPETGCMFNSDQGVQYASYKYIKDLNANRLNIQL